MPTWPRKLEAGAEYYTPPTEAGTDTRPLSLGSDPRRLEAELEDRPLSLGTDVRRPILPTHPIPTRVGRPHVRLCARYTCACVRRSSRLRGEAAASWGSGAATLVRWW